MMEVVFSLQEIGSAAQKILQAQPHQVMLFRGGMGAGKTTLIKALAKALGVSGATASPTFSLVNEYAVTHGKLYHFDMYRIKSQAEALDMGIEEYFYSGNWCFVEWPERIPDLIPHRHSLVTLEILSDGNRQLSFQNFG